MDSPLVDLISDDEHDRRLIEQVRPSRWTNPTPAKRYHLVVIGGGTAGLVCAVGAAGLGARVALVEKRLLGGDCLNFGCVPSKGLIRAARAWHATRSAVPFGMNATSATGDFATAMARMRKLRATIAPHDGAERLSKLGIDVFFGQARFIAQNRVEVGSTTLRFRRAVVATGGRPAVPSIPGLADSGYLTNETVFNLQELPKRLVVVGAGPIGCELAQTFARFGSQVTILDQAERVLPREDEDAAAIVLRALERDGVRYVSRSELREVKNTGGESRVFYRQEGRTEQVAADRILVAVGRLPNVESLGLEQAGVEHDASGVTVDDRLRTANRRIYACGDVASRYKFTHAADAQARIVIQNALLFGRVRAHRLVIPWCTYTSPEVAHVGLNERSAAAAGIATETLTVALDQVDRAILDGETEGFLRLHLEKGNDRIVGATLVAEHAGETIGELCLAVAAGVGLNRIAQTVHPYPTQAEIIKKAADAWRRGRLTPNVQRVLSAYFRIFR